MAQQLGIEEAADLRGVRCGTDYPRSVLLSGVHVIRMKLASGKQAEYHYARRGGPRLAGAPGSPEYIASFNDARGA